MRQLQQWMDAKGKRDGDVAKAIRISRPQINRIRRGITTASPATAHRLEALTGIKWFYFIEKKMARAAKRGARREKQPVEA